MSQLSVFLQKVDELGEAVGPLAQLHGQPGRHQHHAASQHQQQRRGHHPRGEAPAHPHPPPQLLHRGFHHGAQGQGQQEGEQGIMGAASSLLAKLPDAGLFLVTSVLAVYFTSLNYAASRA